MIPFLRPAAVLPLILAAVLLPGPCASLRAADDDAAPRRAEADELLKAMNVGQSVSMASKRMLTSMDGIADRLSKQPNLTPEQTTDIQKFRDDMHALVDQQLGWDAVKGDVVQAYADDFTEAELKELTAFYHSAAGQKLVEKQPEFTEKLSKAMQAKSVALMPSIRQKIQAINAEVHPPAPKAAAAPAAGPAASPAPVVMIPAPTPAATAPAVTAATAPVAAPTATPTP